MRARKLAMFGAVVALALGATACSSVSTGPGQVALHYSGGSLDSKKFKGCVGTSTRNNNQGVSETFYYYPAGRRTWKFGPAGGDSPALTASTKDQQKLTVRGTITFTVNTSCAEFVDDDGKKWPGGKLQKFHETIGSKEWNGEHAYSTSDSDPGKGWDAMIGVYIGDIADRAIDNAGLKYGYAELYNDSAKKAQWEKDVIAAIPALVTAQAGEDFFTVENVVLQKPDIPTALEDQLTAKQAAILRGQAAGEDKRTAANWPGGIEGYLRYQRELAMNEAIKKSDGVQVLPVPQGVGVNIGAGK